MEQEKITLNGQEVTKEQLEEKKEKIESNKGMKVVEEKKNTFKIRIQE